MKEILSKKTMRDSKNIFPRTWNEVIIHIYSFMTTLSSPPHDLSPSFMTIDHLISITTVDVPSSLVTFQLLSGLFLFLCHFLKFSFLHHVDAQIQYFGCMIQTLGLLTPF